MKTSEHRTPVPRVRRKRFALVLGGGGLKGFAHIGVLKALRELSMKPEVVAGTSIGALICAGYAAGMPIEEMEERARSLRRRALFRLNRLGMILERQHSPSIYQKGPLYEVCESVVKENDFNKLQTRLLVNTVDLERGSPVVWGLPGLRDVKVVDAVYASCALPGFYPPGDVGGRACVDGGVVDNLPVSIASQGMDMVIAVDTGSSELLTQRDIAKHGFTAIYMRAATTMMHALQLEQLVSWSSPPMILIRPKVNHIGWFSFTHADELMKAGYDAAIEALQHFEASIRANSGVFPRRIVRVSVDKAKCIGCTLCVAMAPNVMQMDADGKASAKSPTVDWSPADGDFVHHCPTYAINAEPDTPVVDTLPEDTEARTPQEKVERPETT
jgi:NTE family protein